jgi:hypothetical protein
MIGVPARGTAGKDKGGGGDGDKIDGIFVAKAAKG